MVGIHVGATGPRRRTEPWYRPRCRRAESRGSPPDRARSTDAASTLTVKRSRISQRSKPGVSLRTPGGGRKSAPIAPTKPDKIGLASVCLCLTAQADVPPWTRGAKTYPGLRTSGNPAPLHGRDDSIGRATSARVGRASMNDTGKALHGSWLRGRTLGPTLATRNSLTLAEPPVGAAPEAGAKKPDTFGSAPY
jgi:hypothetical protein